MKAKKEKTQHIVIELCTTLSQKALKAIAKAAFSEAGKVRRVLIDTTDD